MNPRSDLAGLTSRRKTPQASHPERSGGLAEPSRRTSSSRRGCRRWLVDFSPRIARIVGNSKSLKSVKSVVAPWPPPASAHEKLEVLRLRSVPPAPRNSPQDDGWSARAASARRASAAVAQASGLPYRSASRLPQRALRTRRRNSVSAPCRRTRGKRDACDTAGEDACATTLRETFAPSP